MNRKERKALDCLKATMGDRFLGQLPIARLLALAIHESIESTWLQRIKYFLKGEKWYKQKYRDAQLGIDDAIIAYEKMVAKESKKALIGGAAE